MRPIDADALKTKIQKIKAEALEHGFAPESVCGDILLNFLDNAPTIEAKPIVHAHWNADGRCTNCGGYAPFFAYADDWFETKYCPHCGAQMDEVAGDINGGSKGVKIPVISMEDVPKIMEEMENNA